MISIQDLAYVRYQAVDLDAMEAFLTDFGLFRAARTDQTLYMRCNSGLPYVHVTDLGSENRAMAFGVVAANMQDLEQLAAECGATVEPNPEPAGGFMVKLVDPSGYEVTVLAGMNSVAPIPARSTTAHNYAAERGRLGAGVRLQAGPSKVQRLGHVALRCSDLAGSLAFYTQKLGMRVSGSGWAGTEDNICAYFLHCGLGKQFTDHHTIAIFKRPESKMDHSAFEVLDWDDVVQGNQHLLRAGHAHQWGIGRHVEGSQIFDYWRDPFGNKIEHWTDGDVVNEDHIGVSAQLSPEGLYQWGPDVPADFYK
jgi:catechol 2,3-dioxygenase-like lactoylglutathione lyase family enzyme